MHRLQCLAALAVIAAGIGGGTSAQANMVVGNAVLIQQDVARLTIRIGRKRAKATTSSKPSSSALR
jgi:hypothetical protein